MRIRNPEFNPPFFSLVNIFKLIISPSGRSGEGEEALSKRLAEAQAEVAALKLERDALKRLLRDRESAEGKVLHTGAQHQFIINIFIGFVGMGVFSNLHSVVAALLLC
jgi:xanthine dehydrogenase molybdopterin-binding subunit B